MKKSLLVVLSLFLFSCNNGRVNTPSSPFDDHYSPIGMFGEYNIDLNQISNAELQQLEDITSKTGAAAIDNDSKVNKFTSHEETRNLKYAYFGSEDASASLCSMVTVDRIATRYPEGSDGAVSVAETYTDMQNQIVNGGVIKNHADIIDYTYDSHYVDSTTYSSLGTNYGMRESVSNNYSKAYVTQTTAEDTSLTDNTPFTLYPYTNQIASHFETLAFFVFQNPNKAIYGKGVLNNENVYIIKEALSEFSPYSTTVGRSYKAVKNYFYEAIYKDFDSTSTLDLRLVEFRFYYEMLILSEAYYENVPIIYLDKPAQVEYSETKYSISYDTLSPYSKNIPTPDPNF